MSTLKDRLSTDLTAAIKAHEEVKVAALRMTLAAIHTEEVAGKAARELSDDEMLTVVAREAKKRAEAAEAFDKGDRPELAARERAEGDVLATYLPAQLSDEELAGIVGTAIAETGATEVRQLGQVMKVALPRVGKRADGGRVSAEVRRQLS